MHDDEDYQLTEPFGLTKKEAKALVEAGDDLVVTHNREALGAGGDGGKAADGHRTSRHANRRTNRQATGTRTSLPDHP